MENIKTIETIKEKLIRVKDDILVFINNECYLKFTKIFQFPGSPNAFIAHLNIWDDNAPFYILFDRSHLQMLRIKGYNKCFFIPNSFTTGWDKNKKMYLRCTIQDPTTYLKYYPITSMKDIRELVKLRQSDHNIIAGFSKNTNGISTKGEAIEILTFKRYVTVKKNIQEQIQK